VESPTGPILPVSASNIEDIENNYPNERLVVSANTSFGDNLSLMIRANYYGEHWDERGGINDPAPNTSWEVGATTYIDVDLAYQLNDNWRINLGANNIFDEFVDVIPDDGIHANRIGAGLPYPRRSAANYEGGMWYLRGTYSFQ